jgi:hypothetical protein
MFLAIESAIQANHAMAPIAALRIDCLIGCHGIEPRADPAALFELVAFQVDLEEGRLKRILGQLSVSQVMPQVVVQLGLIPTNQLLKGFPIAFAPVAEEKFLIGLFGEGGAIGGTWPDLFHRARHLIRIPVEESSTDSAGDRLSQTPNPHESLHKKSLF